MLLDQPVVLVRETVQILKVRFRGSELRKAPGCRSVLHGMFGMKGAAGVHKLRQLWFFLMARFAVNVQTSQVCKEAANVLLPRPLRKSLPLRSFGKFGISPQFCLTDPAKFSG